ncbi:DUF6279 family lipoprotein [Litorivivens lipolytica]|uniref:DUF6279 family lipoprotein n=1 Tax=Litorivivens lipolytica TaxID=1524264 RepID=UPI0031B58A27
MCLILVLFISACSSTQFAYNRAAWFAQWQIEQLVDLNDDQQSRLEQRLELLHSWHRREELPRYHALILQVGNLLENGVTEPGYLKLSDQMEDLWLRLLNRSLDELVLLLPSLSDEQVAELLASMSDKNDEFYRKWIVIPEEELIERRRERVFDSLEQWTGDITQAQRERVVEWAENAPDVYTLWYNQRLKRHEAFAQLLAERKTADVKSGLRALTVVDESRLQAWELRRLEDNRRRANALMIWLGQNLTPQQRDHLLEELAEIAEDVHQLQSQG